MMENAGIPVTYDLNNRNTDMWSSSGSFIWVFLIFAMMMWGGNGMWGGNHSGLNQVTNDFLYTNLNSRLGDGITQLTQQNFEAQKDGWQQSQAVQMALAQNGFITQNNTKDLQMQLAQNAFQSQQCCCETQKAIAAVQAENYKNTCEITTAIHAEGEATRALITQNVMQDLRDKLADRDRDLQTANLHLSQQAQNATLIGALRPTPIPAYVTNSPYQSVSACSGCNN